MHKPSSVSHIRHHPDIRWIIAVTAMIVTALSLTFFALWNLTKPSSILAQKNEQQARYISELTKAVTQLSIINNALQEEIKNQDQTIRILRAELTKTNDSATSTESESDSR